MTLIKGKQLATGADGVANGNIVDLTIEAGKLAGSIPASKMVLTSGWDFTTAAPTYNADPSNANDLARKSYVDALAQGLRDFKDSAVLATTANLAATRSGNVLTASAN